MTQSAPTPPYRMTFLVHAPELVDLMKLALRGRFEQMSYEFIDFESGPAKARACLEAGSEVIICHGGTGDAIRRSVGHSVVSIDRTDMDVIKTLRRAKQMSDEVILAAFRDEKHDREEIESILNMRIHHISYGSNAALAADVQRAYDRGLRVLVGGGVSKRYIEELGGTGFVIEPSQHSIRLALDHAVAIARQKREESMRHADLVAIFTQLQEGVLCIDAEERLVFSNPLAFRMLGLAPDAREEDLSPFFGPLGLQDVLRTMSPRPDNVASMAGESFVVRSFPLTMHGNLRCAVAFFRDVPSLQKINRKIGEELYVKGFVARTGLEDIIGESRSMIDLKEKIRRFAKVDASVLISGETGTGKELVAHALHRESPRRRSPFVAVNFASLSPHLIESELFGYEDGAFTGAKRGGKMGLFEMADQGTLFLDEIGEISHELQLRLLRILEAREVMRVGGSRIFSVNVRIISASHRPLLELVHSGRFRLDLYYRLSTLKLPLPPLRERAEDIPLILRRLLHRHGKPESVISPDMFEALRGAAWPGNVRELLALVESYLILLDKPEADSKLFHSLLGENKSPAGRDGGIPPDWDPARPLKENLEAARLRFIRQAVKHHGGDRQLAALKLGISYTTLWRTLKEQEPFHDRSDEKP